MRGGLRRVPLGGVALSAPSAHLASKIVWIASMPQQLNIRNDEAYEIATRLARRTGRTRSDIVLAALLSYSESKTGDGLAPDERAFVDEIISLIRGQVPAIAGATR